MDLRKNKPRGPGTLARLRSAAVPSYGSDSCLRLEAQPSGNDKSFSELENTLYQ
jgi:hypothetical protein